MFLGVWFCSGFLLRFLSFANGIRHLFWDFGIGLSLDGVYRGGYIVIGLTLLSSLGGIYMFFG